MSTRSWRDVPPNGSPSSMDGDYGGTLPLPFSLIRGRPENVAHPLGRSPCFQLPQPGFNRSVHSSSRTLVANTARPSQGKCPTQGPRPTASAHPPELGALRACCHRGSEGLRHRAKRLAVPTASGSPARPGRTAGGAASRHRPGELQRAIGTWVSGEPRFLCCWTVPRGHTSHERTNGWIAVREPLDPALSAKPGSTEHPWRSCAGWRR